MAQQTAVEWIVEELKSNGHALITTEGIFINVPNELLEQAKKMEKNQMIDAFLSSHSKWIGDAESYYQDTYSHPDPSDDEIYNNFNHEGGIKYENDK